MYNVTSAGGGKASSGRVEGIEEGREKIESGRKGVGQTSERQGGREAQLRQEKVMGEWEGVKRKARGKTRGEMVMFTVNVCQW